MHIERNACSSECAWLARETCIYIICNYLKSWYEFPDSYAIYKHDLFIQIYAAAYAFGCVHTYIHINVYVWYLSSLLCIEVLVFIRARAGVPQVFSRFFEWFIRAFVSAAVLTRAGAVFLWIASKYKVSTFLETPNWNHQHSESQVASGDLYDSIAIENNEFGCLRLQTCQFTLHLVQISYSHSYIIYINIQTYTSNYKVLMQCHANKFQTVSNLLVQVLCLDAVCLDSKPSKPLIKQHIAAYLQKYLRDFGCHSSILVPCKLALGRAKSWTKGTSVVSCQHYLGLYLLCLPHQCNRLP